MDGHVWSSAHRRKDLRLYQRRLASEDSDLLEIRLAPLPMPLFQHRQHTRPHLSVGENFPELVVFALVLAIDLVQDRLKRIQ